MSRNSDAALRPVAEVMQREVATLTIHDRLDLADDVMRLGRVRHMPVLDGTRVVGIVSNRDLLAASLSRVLDFAATDRRTFLRSIEVSEVMSHDLISVRDDATLREAAELMLRHRIGCLPVVKADRTLIGLVTETDLLKAALLPGSERSGIANPKEETIMSDWKARGQKEIDELRRVRDELKVRMHLAKAEVKDRWNELEHQFHNLEAKGHQIAQASEEPLRDVRDAAKLLVAEIREGYRRIRESL
ncbi:MAG TPA: CBS domain-containing protein [Myxococcota bacterium]